MFVGFQLDMYKLNPLKSVFFISLKTQKELIYPLHPCPISLPEQIRSLFFISIK